MAATNDADQLRIDLENVMASLAQVEEHLRVAKMLLGQWARTDYEVRIFNEMVAASRYARTGREALAEIHPNGRKTNG